MRYRAGKMTAMAFGLALAAGSATADEMAGRVKSVDAAAHTVVVTDDSTSKDSTITVDSGTSWIKEKKGKVSKKFELANLKVGSKVEVTREAGLASRVVIKAGKKKAKTT